MSKAGGEGLGPREQASRALEKASHAVRVHADVFFTEATRREALDPMTVAFKEGKVYFPPNSWLEDCLFYLRNTHVLLAVFLAHPAHPFPRKRRALVLISSLAFAFFITSLLKGTGLAKLGPVSIVGAILQLFWDVPGSMLGTCPCASTPVLPVWLRKCCESASFCCLMCHFLFGLLYIALACILLSVLPGENLNSFAQDFIVSKVLSFVFALPTNVAVFALLYQCQKSKANHEHTTATNGDGGGASSRGRSTCML